ncbi:mitochondrial carrier, thiamine pyrophosphate [Schizosaccharomyces pombe]|uniref:Uncharacterized mitochondrial carrier C1604.04 n=1 Tax=Schizosaccharomyces pombe (strain 972 / ATCC 24843) TaxID=284812 RepID=YG04_SCHPO|nr:putative thiamine pyrophosphate transporter [Schizosaccharomyces pombe]O94370.2 RecName: Full=Uncharacterized mitochondrial carrier C1604.04 [Schizosaccharomyces pombe 972h-]CAA22337.2 mitochondrial thiamine pyrophosphate transporter (predicted) [Schizosaccharomyces pombe]|eukprot:NP_596636.2 putative thiamine pyrophosphate transporter [Schizosaccharomyces pombe]
MGLAKQKDSQEFAQPVWHYTLAGGISSVICRFMIAPFDVIKIRMQITQSSLRPVFKETVQKEGVRALWRGNVVAELLYLVYGAAEFVAFSKLKHLTENLAMNDHAVNFLCGTSAGIFATLTSYPLDTMRTKFASYAKTPHMLPATKKIYAEAGIKGFFPGLKFSVIQIGPYAGCFFMFYRASEAVLSPLGLALSSTLSGVIAGAGSKAIMFPVDTVVKTLQTFPSNYKSFKDCFLSIYRNSGIKGLYRGLSVSMLKVAPGRAITMLIYEQTLQGLRTLSSPEA